MSEQKIPVLYEFDWEHVEGLAEYDAETGVVTMKIQPGGPVHQLLSRTSDTDEIRTLSFGWTRKRWIEAAEPPPVDPDQIAETP